MLFVPKENRERLRVIAGQLHKNQLTPEIAIARMREIDPDYPFAHLLAGSLAAENGDFDQAEQELWSAIKRRPLDCSAYLSLADVRSRHTDDPLRRTLIILAFRKLAAADTVPPSIANTFKNDFGKGLQADYTNPATFEAMAEALEEGAKDELPPDLSERILPYTLLADVQHDAAQGVDALALAEILSNTEACAPVWHAAICEWAQSNTPPPDGTAALLIAMLGEMGGPEHVPDLFEAMQVDNHTIWLHGNWAIYRIGQRHPSKTLEKLSAAVPGASVTLRCGLAEHIGRLPRDRGLPVEPVLLALLDRFASTAKHKEAPFLLMAVADALSEHGHERQAETILQTYRDLLPGAGRKKLAKVLSSENGFVPILLAEGLDELTVEEVCCDLFLMDDKDADEDDSDTELEEQDESPFQLPPGVSTTRQPLVTTAVSKAKPGRNDACWCGSGKKYKKCHLAQDEQESSNAAQQPEFGEARHTGDFDVVRELIDFTSATYTRNDLVRGTRQFFDERPDKVDPERAGTGGFFDWYLCDFRAPSIGRTAVDQYLLERGARLSGSERELLESFKQSRYGLFEVQKVEVDKGVELKDVFTSETFFVHDVTSSRSLVQWDYLLTRVQVLKDRHLFAGNGITVPRTMASRFIDFVRDESKREGIPPERFVRLNSHRLHRDVWSTSTDLLEDMEMRNAEGDSICFSSARYHVSDEAALLEVLRAIPEFEELDPTAEGKTTFGWLDPPSGDTPRRSYGSLTIDRGELKLECNSRERLERGRMLLEQSARTYMRHKGDTFESFEAVKRRAGQNRNEALPSSSLSPELEQELLHEFKARHYATWPDTALPALNNKTPRQAMKTAKGREAVLDLIRSFENGEAHAKKEGKPAFDFSDLRKSLGLADTP